MSTWVHTQACVGARMHLEGPFGHTTLEDSDSPVLCVAGGSGLAPIWALLCQALSQNTGPITLVFGARTQRDLYFERELADLVTQFSGRLKVHCVLSEEPKDSDWEGQRGLVTAAIGHDFQGRAYLCGPPGMVDAARAALSHLPVDHIKADAFYDRGAAAPAVAGAA